MPLSKGTSQVKANLKPSVRDKLLAAARGAEAEAESLAEPPEMAGADADLLRSPDLELAGAASSPVDVDVPAAAAAAVASPRSGRPSRPRPVKPVRFTLDMDPALHRVLKEFAVEWSADASEVMRELLRVMREDKQLARRVRDRIWNAVQ